MVPRQLTTEYLEYASASELPSEDQALLQEAIEATKMAYAPYSKFHVGAAATLDNGVTITGTNQENASSPAGICAERVLLSAISSRFPSATIITLAISYDSDHGPSDHPVTPCGICRQSLSEFEIRTGKPIRLILGGISGSVYVLSNASELLPMAFTGRELGKGKQG